MITRDFEADWLSSPGDTIADALEDRSLDKDFLASSLSASLADVDELLRGNAPLTEEIASVLAASLGGTQSFWLRREEHYRNALHTRASHLDPNECNLWLSRIPVSEMAARGDVNPSRDVRERAIQCLRFFGVPSFAAWEQKYSPIVDGTSFRTSGAFESDPCAVALWLREGQVRAARVVTAEWNPFALRAQIAAMRQLTLVHEPAKFVPALRSLCSGCGVALVVMRAPSKCHASGAAMALPRNRMLVMLSFRHLSDDHFWFSFFHEIGHLLLHIHKDGLIIDEGETGHLDGEEAEANRFAGATLIPDEHVSEMRSLQRDRWQVARFAHRIGVSPGIVVGQLQHLGHFAQSQMNHLKRRYTPQDVDAVSL